MKTDQKQVELAHTQADLLLMPQQDQSILLDMLSQAQIIGVQMLVLGTTVQVMLLIMEMDGIDLLKTDGQEMNMAGIPSNGVLLAKYGTDLLVLVKAVTGYLLDKHGTDLLVLKMVLTVDLLVRHGMESSVLLAKEATGRMVHTQLPE